LLPTSVTFGGDLSVAAARQQDVPPPLKGRGLSMRWYDGVVGLTVSVTLMGHRVSKCHADCPLWLIAYACRVGYRCGWMSGG
jgi:hypothetical protein